MTKLQLSPDHKKILLSAFLSGIAFPGNQLGLLSLVSYIPFLYVLHNIDKSKWSFFKVGALFGTYYSFFAMYWVGLSTFGGFIGMTLTIAIRFGLMTLLFKLLVKEKAYFISIVCFFVLQEYLCAYSDLDYTWHLAGYSLTDFPILCQAAEYTGVYGLSFFVYLVNTLLFLSYVEKRHTKRILSTVVVICVLFVSVNLTIYSSYKKEELKAVRVGILQPNIDPFVKWQEKYKVLAVKKLIEQTDSVISMGADHIVFPETSVPYYLRYNLSTAIRNRLIKTARDSNATLVVGALDSQNRTPYNTVFHFFPDGRNFDTYYKQKLVPVAEKVIYPAVMAIFGDLLPGMSGWGKGTEVKTFIAMNNVYSFNSISNQYVFSKRDTMRFASTICIESTFPEFISQFKLKGVRWINIITNDGWFYPHWGWFKELANSFGFSPFFKGKGAYQHNQLTILRAIENRISIVRSANTGISSIIDPLGDIRNSLDQYKDGVIVDYVPILENRLTFFNRFGVWIVWLNIYLLCAVILVLFYKRIRRT